MCRRASSLFKRVDVWLVPAYTCRRVSFQLKRPDVFCNFLAKVLSQANSTKFNPFWPKLCPWRIISFSTIFQHLEQICHILSVSMYLNLHIVKELQYKPSPSFGKLVSILNHIITFRYLSFNRSTAFICDHE